MADQLKHAESDYVRVVNERDRITQDRDRIAKEMELLKNEMDRIAEERDRIIAERDQIVEEREQMVEERVRMIDEKELRDKEQQDMNLIMFNKGKDSCMSDIHKLALITWFVLESKNHRSPKERRRKEKDAKRY